MSPIRYEGMLRVETLEIPEKALRETIINALIHRDYASAAAISLRVFDSKIVIWNDGELNKISIADLKKPHDSYPRNPLLAKVFFMSGYIEAWGRGIKTIVDETVKSGLPEPEFVARQNGLEVNYQRNPMRLSEKGLETSPKVELSVRQQKAMDYVKVHGSISNKIYQEINNVSKPTATRDLAEMVTSQLLEPQGSGRSAVYILSAHNRLIIGSTHECIWAGGSCLNTL
ncbi:ATP-dependent DNA helicase [Mucinivorans hirudinis]|uniref:ATP-dependent DNA helicase n=1 Tax=Mucinivorans hirudinis TaxID=1433126 RepID=A0A060RAG3_9BACT|nr:ATP-dependent DNA helicase [Mucinivorans hirudinis]